MTIQEVSPQGITLQLNNSGTGYFSFGEYYALEYQKDDQWYVVPYATEENIGFNDIAYVLEAGQSMVWSTDFTNFYGELAPGHYRVIKDAMKSDDSNEILSLSVEFDLE